jgi:hypothetical protein
MTSVTAPPAIPPLPCACPPEFDAISTIAAEKRDGDRSRDEAASPAKTSEQMRGLGRFSRIRLEGPSHSAFYSDRVCGVQDERYTGMGIELLRYIPLTVGGHSGSLNIHTNTTN